MSAKPLAIDDDDFEATLNKALDLVNIELHHAFERHGDFRSMHEGYAVILEELDELWDEVKKRGAKQVAAMGVKFLMFMLRNGKHSP